MSRSTCRSSSSTNCMQECKGLRREEIVRIGFWTSRLRNSKVE